MKRGSGVAEAKIASWLFRLCSAIVASLPENELTDVGCSLSSGRCYRIVAHNFDYCRRCSIRADYLSNVDYLQWKILYDGWVISGIAELCWPDAKCLQKKKSPGESQKSLQMIKNIKESFRMAWEIGSDCRETNKIPTEAKNNESMGTSKWTRSEQKQL